MLPAEYFYKEKNGDKRANRILILDVFIQAMNTHIPEHGNNRLDKSTNINLANFQIPQVCVQNIFDQSNFISRKWHSLIYKDTLIARIVHI